MEKVEKMNIVVVRNLLQGQEKKEREIRRDFYTIDINRGGNCYSYGKFGHLVRNCRNWNIVGQRKRIEYEDNINNMNNLKEKKSLVVLN